MTAKTRKEKGKRARERGVIITSNRAEWLMTYHLTATESNREEVRVNGCVEGYLHIWVLGPIINTQAQECISCCHIDSWQSVLLTYSRFVITLSAGKKKKKVIRHLYESLGWLHVCFAHLKDKVNCRSGTLGLLRKVEYVRHCEQKKESLTRGGSRQVRVMDESMCQGKLTWP